MKYITFWNRSVFALLILISISFSQLLTGCKNDLEDSVTNKNYIESNIVSLDQVKQIATQQSNSIKYSKNNKTAQTEKNIKEIFPYKTKSSLTSFYIVNYETGGFSIISADNRLYPIQAFSDNGSFETNIEKIPPFITDWLLALEQTVMKTRTKNEKQSPHLKNLWDTFSVENPFQPSEQINKRVADIPCSYEGQNTTVYTEKEALTVEWNQRAPFNKDLANVGCSETSNGKYLVGCNAVAIAEILQYHKKASIPYDWAAMQIDRTHPTISFMMSVLGSAGFLNMNYGCDESKSLNSRIDQAFFNYGFTNVVKSNYNFYTLKSQLDMNRPILVLARKGSSITSTGHTWVCDGYKQLDNYSCHWDIIDGEWQSLFQSTYALSHMNWGWSETSFNGYYNYNDFSPSTDNSYPYNHEMYSINPN